MAQARPVIVIVGRPNVGKSTLFNRITGSRDALVHDLPGVTRDRLYGEGRRDGRSFWVVDTGGLEGSDEDRLGEPLARQTLFAIDEADVVVMLVDVRAGLTPADRMIAERLRRSDRPVVVAANKAEGLESATAAAEFHELGLGEPVAISAEHGQGMARLMDRVLSVIADPGEDEPRDGDDASRVPQVALVGRPNVGKSTLSNALVGAERVVVSDIPGTTRDTVRIPLERDDWRVDLLDTAGVRRRARLDPGLEQLSVIRTLRTLEEADVVLLLIDARAGVSDQDAHLAGLVRHHGRAAVLVINKWDGLDGHQRARMRAEVERTLGFLGNVEHLYVSALRGGGLGEILPAVRRAHDSAMHDFGTGELNRILAAAITAHAPPTVGGRRIRIKYAHQGGRNPPLIVLHGNQLDHVPESYRRYLVNCITRAARLVGVPVRIVFHEGRNPFAARSRRRGQERARQRPGRH